MKHLFTSLIATFGLLLTLAAQAANVTPLGLEIGVATLEQVKAQLGSSQLTETGINAYSDGPMLSGAGEGLDIEGLQKILFIFDQHNKLAGVVMTLGKHRFDEIYEHLSGKYRVKTRKIPFVGDRYVHLTQGNSLVEISSPHMSFEMEVRYLSNALMTAFKTRSAEEEQQRRKTQGAKF